VDASPPDSSPTLAVTGGSGFIGSHVVDALLGAGYAVRVLDQRPPRQRDAEWAEVDLLEQDALTDALKGCGPVFHLAAMADVNDVIAQPAESVAVTVLGAARVLEAARRADTGRVILASTVWVYAATHGDVVDEDTPFDLRAERHIYASSKLAAEMFPMEAPRSLPSKRAVPLSVTLPSLPSAFKPPVKSPPESKPLPAKSAIVAPAPGCNPGHEAIAASIVGAPQAVKVVAMAFWALVTLRNRASPTLLVSRPSKKWRPTLRT